MTLDIKFSMWAQVEKHAPFASMNAHWSAACCDEEMQQMKITLQFTALQFR